jgi:hypothetical protein
MRAPRPTRTGADLHARQRGDHRALAEPGAGAEPDDPAARLDPAAGAERGAVGQLHARPGSDVHACALGDPHTGSGSKPAAGAQAQQEEACGHRRQR